MAQVIHLTKFQIPKPKTTHKICYSRFCVLFWVLVDYSFYTDSIQIERQRSLIHSRKNKLGESSLQIGDENE